MAEEDPRSDTEGVDEAAGEPGDGDEFEEGLDELKEMLAGEGVDVDEAASPDTVLERLDAETETGSEAGGGREPSRRRAKRGTTRERRTREDQAFRDLDSQLSGEVMEIKVAEDGMSAVVSRIGEDDDLDAILQELRRQKITVGIDEAAIVAAVERAANGSPQYDVVVARGRAPQVDRPAHVRYHLPEGLSEVGDDPPLQRLSEALSAPNLDLINSWDGLCHLVHKGELLTEVVAAEGDIGQSVRGEDIPLEIGEEPELVPAEHVLLSEDGRQCLAGAYGYAGMLKEGPSVVVPLWVAPDAMEARFVCLQSGASAPSEVEFAEVLSARWIEHGVDGEALGKVRQTLERGKDLPLTVQVAKGIKPEPGTPGQIQCLVPFQQLPAWKQLQSLLNLRERPGLEEGLAEMAAPERSTVFLPVGPGDVVASLEPSQEGTAGRDVLGEEIEAAEVEEVQLEVGDNVVVAEDGLRAQASSFGYLSLYGSAQISVVSPLWLAGDRMTLGYLNLPQGETVRYPSAEEMAQLLVEDAHLQGAQADAWDQVRQGLEGGKLADLLVVIAEGTQARPARDDTFEWAVKRGGGPGTILEDGSVDLRDRQLITMVQEGDLIGRFTPGEPGEVGRDVLGNHINPRASRALEVVGDSSINSVTEGDEGVVGFYAAMSGGVESTEESRSARGAQYTRIRLGLFAISEIGGDVDYGTGHVDFHGDVIIKGSVRALFRVTTSGSVVIGENVETGARIEAGGDILVSGGVVGEATELIAGGNVMAKFVHEASVRAGGDVEIGAYVHEASVRAAGAIKVTGAGEGGGRALVGGLVWAGKGIEAPSLGSASNPRIRLVAGTDPVLLEQTEEVGSKIRACEALERAALKALNLRQLDVHFIKQKTKALEGDERDDYLAQAKQLAEYIDLHHHLQARLHQTAQKQRELAGKAVITVPGPVIAGAELRIGEHSLRVAADGSYLRFRLTEEDGQVRLQAEAL